MKILIASDIYRPHANGVVSFMQRLALKLVERGHQVFIFAPSRSFKNTKHNQQGIIVYGFHSIPIFAYPNLRLPPLFLINKPVQQALHQVNPDVIHIQNCFIIGKVLADEARKNNIPIVGTNHLMPENVLPHLRLPKFTEGQVRKFGWRQISKMYAKLDAITTPTETAADLMKKYGLTKYIIPISCGIDLKIFNPHNKGAYLKKSYPIKDKPTILFVGRLDKEKSIDTIIKSMPALLNKIDAQLIIAGKGKELTRLKNLAQKLNVEKAIIFTGFIPDADLPHLYALADVFVASGIAELQSISTLEALATGLPVVGANTVALPELIHHGENGLLFPPYDNLALANCILKILSDRKLQKKMGKKSLQIIRKHDINKVVTEYEQLYMKLVNNKAKTNS